jgi:hypothetical protein
MKKDSTIEHGIDLATRFYAHDIPCKANRHRHSGTGNPVLSIGFQVDKDWAVLA